MMASKHKEEQDERSISQFFFEKGYGACWADAFMAMPMLPQSFPLTDAAVDRAWDVLPMCQDTSEDYVEFDKRKALSDAAPELLARLKSERENRDNILRFLLDGHTEMVIDMLRNGGKATDDVIAKATGAA